MFDTIAPRRPAQDENPLISLDEGHFLALSADDILPGSDPFDELTVTAPFWQQRKALDLAENMTLGAILMAHATGRFSSVEAFGAMQERELVDYDQLLFMIATQHRCAKMIDEG